MGVGISAHRLAGAVASENAIGTIASVDLRHQHPDLLEKTIKCRDRAAIDQANCVALDRDIRAARQLSKGRGLLAGKVMKDVREQPATVKQPCQSSAATDA